MTDDRFITRLLQPNDEAYDEARALWNGMIDKRPAVIARCSTSADVIEALNYARENGLRVAARGGGHGVAGNALNDGGLVVDLSPMKAIEVDVSAKTVRAEPGVTLGEIDAATQAHGLATPLGVVSQTGIAGLTLGGGIGWLRRKHGLAADNVLSFEVGDRRRPACDRGRVGERRPLLGAPRRRRRPRRRHLVRVSALRPRPRGDVRVRPVRRRTNG
jgi:FAD/FMN-containing dehydrogenase